MSSTRIVYEDSRVTEYDDGTERVYFSEDEYVFMAEDPQEWGYTCPSGMHFAYGGFDARGLCGKCEANMGDFDGSDVDEATLPYPSELKPKRIKCGKCGEKHRHVAMVKLCHNIR